MASLQSSHLSNSALDQFDHPIRESWRDWAFLIIWISIAAIIRSPLLMAKSIRASRQQ